MKRRFNSLIRINRWNFNEIKKYKKLKNYLKKTESTILSKPIINGSDSEQEEPLSYKNTSLPSDYKD